MSKKTNIEYLREFVKDNDEANEFMDAIQEKFDAADTVLKDKEDEITSLEENITRLKNELQEAEEEPKNEIKAGIGVIRWESDNLRLIGLMELLDEKIIQYGDLPVYNALNSI